MTASGRSLRDALEDYLALRRALGFRLATVGRLLGQFADWLGARGASTITTADALEWAVLPAGASPAWQAIRLAAVRGFAAYLHGTDPSAEVPPAGLIRRGNDRATPYLYSDTEISAIITAAGTLRPRFRAATYQALISLLAASGQDRRGTRPRPRRPRRRRRRAHRAGLEIREDETGPAAPQYDRRADPVLGAAGRASSPPGRPGTVPVHRRDTAAAQQRRPHVHAAHEAGRADPAVSVLPAPNS